MWTKRGAEFIDLKGNSHMRHDWLRASCRLGFMPCNGLLYVPPHQCFCYREALLNGFNALAHTLDSKRWPLQISQSQRLEKGPAYDDFIEPVVADKDEWPMYRHDSRRTGYVDSNIPFSLQQLWT
jgi:hypothetical protein